MRTCPRPSLPPPRQLRLLSDATLLEGLSPEERCEAIALLAGLLLEASGIVGPEAGNDRG
jgi:hypothetical protein